MKYYYEGIEISRRCPFCGGNGYVISNDTPFFWIECSTCGARTKSVHSDNFRNWEALVNQLRELWDHRVE